jgi:hypothetical protein
MTHKFPAKLKVTDGERYDRFVAATQQIGASDAKNFEKAFQEAFKTAFEKVARSRPAAEYARRRPDSN